MSLPGDHAPDRAPRGWHSRGYLPHFDGGETVQVVCFRCPDSLPAAVVAEWRAKLSHMPAEQASQEIRRLSDAYLDRCAGDAVLGQPAVAHVVQGALLHFDAERYRLHAWVVMPNHVHVLVTPVGANGLSEILHSWKSYTASQVNRLLARRGELWQRESFDRYIRDEEHFVAAAEYIESNPVKAGLCSRPEQWPFGSAAARVREGQTGSSAGLRWLTGQAGSLRSQHEASRIAVQARRPACGPRYDSRHPRRPPNAQW